MNILIAGNDPDTNSLIKTLLDKYDSVSVDIATDQFDLHQRLTIDKPDVLLTSFYIGTSDIKKLISKLTLPKTTILITGKFIESIRDEYPGVSHYLFKPFDYEMLVSLLDLKKKERQESATV